MISNRPAPSSPTNWTQHLGKTATSTLLASLAKPVKVTGLFPPARTSWTLPTKFTACTPPLHVSLAMHVIVLPPHNPLNRLTGRFPKERFNVVLLKLSNLNNGTLLALIHPGLSTENRLTPPLSQLTSPSTFGSDRKSAVCERLKSLKVLSKTSGATPLPPSYPGRTSSKNRMKLPQRLRVRCLPTTLRTKLCSRFPTLFKLNRTARRRRVNP